MQTQGRHSWRGASPFSKRRGSRFDGRILSQQGSVSNDSDVLKTTPLSVVFTDRDPNRADSDRVIRSRELPAERGPVRACVRAAGEVAR